MLVRAAVPGEEGSWLKVRQKSLEMSRSLCWKTDRCTPAVVRAAPSSTAAFPVGLVLGVRLLYARCRYLRNISPSPSETFAISLPKQEHAEHPANHTARPFLCAQSYRACILGAGCYEGGSVPDFPPPPACPAPAWQPRVVLLPAGARRGQGRATTGRKWALIPLLGRPEEGGQRREAEEGPSSSSGLPGAGGEAGAPLGGSARP